MNVKKIMSLQFFAKRIEVNVNSLKWCIVQNKKGDWERSTIPAISIKNAALYYDFLKDTLEEIINYGDTKTIIKEAKVSETRGGYRFEAKGVIIEFSFEEIERTFERKIYSEELNRQAQRFT